MTETGKNIITAEIVTVPRDVQATIPIGDKKIQIALTQTQLRNSKTKEPLPDLLELTFTLMEQKPLSAKGNYHKAINPITKKPYTQFKLSLPEWFNEPGETVKQKLQKSSITGSYYQKIIDAVDSQLFPLAQEKGMITQKDLK